MAIATIQTDENNDIFLPDGRNLIVIVGAEACRQSINQATSMRLGEDLYNKNSGVDYLGKVFTPQPDYDEARQSISDAILSCPDVLGIDSLSISITENLFNYEANVDTIYGPIPVSTP